MKKYFIALISVSCACSCADNKSVDSNNSLREKNLTATKEIDKAIQTGDVSNLGNYIAADGVDHASPFGDVKGIDSISAMLAKVHTMGTGMKMEIIKTLADDEYVFEWMRLTGSTATTDWGMPVGTSYDMNAMQVSRFKDGKAVEHWEFMQPADMARMMSSQAPPAIVKDSIGKVIQK